MLIFNILDLFHNFYATKVRRISQLRKPKVDNSENLNIKCMFSILSSFIAY